MTENDYIEKLRSKNPKIASGQTITLSAEKFLACMRQAYCMGRDTPSEANGFMDSFMDTIRRNPTCTGKSEPYQT